MTWGEMKVYLKYKEDKGLIISLFIIYQSMVNTWHAKVRFVIVKYSPLCFVSDKVNMLEFTAGILGRARLK